MGWWMFPENASEHGADVDTLNFFLHNFMILLFVGWGAFFIYVLIKFRRREGVAALYQPIKARSVKYIEVAVVLVEVALLFMISVPVWKYVKTGFEKVDPKEALEVRLISEQFAWNFHYPGPDGIFGRTDVRLMDGGNPVGLDRSDPYAADDITTRELRLPVNRPIILRVTSKDVIHSVGVPVLRVKQDANPGMEIPIWFTVTKTSEQLRELQARNVKLEKAARWKSFTTMQDYPGADGAILVKRGAVITESMVEPLKAAGIHEVRIAPRDAIELACSQLCGLGHYRMRGVITAETPEQFEKWLASRAPRRPAPAPQQPAPAPEQQPAPPAGEPTPIAPAVDEPPVEADPATEDGQPAVPGEEAAPQAEAPAAPEAPEPAAPEAPAPAAPEAPAQPEPAEQATPAQP
jgi:cytochrome c oxidase subunit II